MGQGCGTGSLSLQSSLLKTVQCHEGKLTVNFMVDIFIYPSAKCCLIFDPLGLELKANTYQITPIKDTLGIVNEKTSQGVILPSSREGKGDNSRMDMHLQEPGM